MGDFGVSHIFEKESKFGAHRMASIDEHQRYHARGRNTDKRFSDSWSESSLSSLEEIAEEDRRFPKLTRKDTDAALSMRGMAGSGMLSKTEGTWCFWSPEMCEGSQSFSGYAADMWAAGVCLYTFVTGRLPFYSEIPQELFETIASSEVPYAGLGLSNSLIDLLKRCLEKDPNLRAGVGDCLKHPFLQIAREKRIRQLSEEFEISNKKKIVVSEDDIKSAFRTVTSVPVQVLRSAGKKIQEGLAHTRDRLSISTSSITEGESIVKHFQEGIQNLCSRLPSMASTMHSGDGENGQDDNVRHMPTRSTNKSPRKSKQNHEQNCVNSKSRTVFFRRGTSDDSDQSIRTFDGNSSAPFDQPSEIGLQNRVSRLSSGVSFSSNATDELPDALYEAENEEDTEIDEQDKSGFAIDLQTPGAEKILNNNVLHQDEHKKLPITSTSEYALSDGLSGSCRSKKHKTKEKRSSQCTVQ